MRIVAIIAAVLLAGCVPGDPQPETGTKVLYMCRPEPPGGCNALKSEGECRKNLRCGWTKRGDGYCHRIYCRDKITD
jgi:hypothetical protein